MAIRIRNPFKMDSSFKIQHVVFAIVNGDYLRLEIGTNDKDKMAILDGFSERILNKLKKEGVKATRVRTWSRDEHDDRKGQWEHSITIPGVQAMHAVEVLGLNNYVMEALNDALFIITAPANDITLSPAAHAAYSRLELCELSWY